VPQRPTDFEADQIQISTFTEASAMAWAARINAAS